MAVSQVPESVGTTATATTTTTTSASVHSDLDLNLASLRRRPLSESSVRPEASEAESSAEDVLRDSGSNYSKAGAEDGNQKLEGPNVINQKVPEQLPDVSALKFAYRPSVPAHRRIKESPLSSDKIFRQSHAGLFNLCIVVLVAVNSRLIIENLMKYGWLIKYDFWFSSRSLRDWPLFMCGLSLAVFPVAAFAVEKLAQKKYIPDPVAFQLTCLGTLTGISQVVVLLHVTITSAAVLYPVLVILRSDSAFLSGIVLMLLACIVWLKLVSYAHTNYDMRAMARSIEKGEALPNTLNIECQFNVSLKSLAYFMVAPTLCYQPSYPRTPYVRKGWVFRQLIKLIVFTGVMGFIIEQYINPIVQNSEHPLKGNLLYALERVLKLSVPNLYVWLCMFYCFFHLWLNILAELLRFGDREFYRDWWNAKTVEEYWRMWNMPVHKWMVRHLYFPCLRNGIPKGVAILIAFLVSAVFHELCIAVPCHIFKLWAFIGIMFQVPLVLITNYLQNKFRSSMVGNMIFWFIFSILGQPMCVLLYYHDLMNRKKKVNQASISSSTMRGDEFL